MKLQDLRTLFIESWKWVLTGRFLLPPGPTMADNLAWYGLVLMGLGTTLFIIGCALTRRGL